MSKNDGGLAFPDPARAGGHCMDPGMTLRDWFAGKFAAQMITTSDWKNMARADVASDAYAYADAMLAERDRA